MKRIVVKIGSNILASGNEGLDTRRIHAIADDISAAQNSGYEVVVVSSGAVAAGMNKLGLKEKPRDIVLKQAAAAVGQSSLMRAYEECFASYKKNVAQVLLTREDFSDRKRYINSKNTLNALLSHGVIPVINENDTVATDELKFGDNDNLAALVAGLIDAERLIILSDVDGLFSDDPRINRNAKLLATVSEITPDIEKRAGGAGTVIGTGGMYSKLIAAKKAMNNGIVVNIINGRKGGLLVSMLNGVKHGTEFVPKGSGLSSRKGWIAHASRSKGSLTIDSGAVKAITSGGKSLLPSGIISLTGRFDSGDAVYCLDSEGNRIAKGIINYSSSEVEQIKGCKTREVEKMLGYRCSDEVIHRDNLVLL